MTTMLASQPEVSDLLFTVDRPLQVESYGELKPVDLDPPIPRLTPFQTEMIALNLIGDNLLLLGKSVAPRLVRRRPTRFRKRPVSASTSSRSAAIIPSSAAS